MNTADLVQADQRLGSSSATGRGDTPDESFWRSLKYFSYYRLVSAGVFLASFMLSEGALNVGSQNPKLFLWCCVAYLGTAITELFILRKWQKSFNLQLSLQVAADILLLTLMLYSSGGAKSGMSMMLLIVLMGAGLVGQGRMVLLYASLATVAILLEQAYRVLQHQGEVADFFRTGVTCIGYFGSAIAARLLAIRVVANEELARKRGIQLADQMQINERVIRDMQDGVLVVDLDGQVKQSNAKAAALLGLPFPLSLTLSASSPLLAGEMPLRRGRGVESEMIMEMPQTGRPVRARFLPPGAGGNMLIFLEDVGRALQETQQLKLAALGRLTANMAHEIRNPLAAISHAAELLVDEPRGAGEQRLINIIGDNTQRLNRLVGEVMELGRRDHATPENIVVGDFLRQLLDELFIRFPESRARISVEMPEEFSVCFDRGHLHRVLTNLLSNALRYASTGETAIRIIGEQDIYPDRASLHIIDDGKGIDATENNQIFEPFFTTHASGTGLGLYIARELCQANGARLILMDNSPGAHFCISCRLKCLNQNQDQVQT